MNDHFGLHPTWVMPWRRYALGLTIIWTAVILLSLAWNVHQAETQTAETARVQARVAYEKDVIYRRWASLQGGVYAPITDLTPANPFLQVAERDIEAPSGIALTLVNPAYMTRQAHEIQNQLQGVLGHITSLKPIRPQNIADAWETEVLRSFETGVEEASVIAEIGGLPYMRLMRPLFTEQSCLKCHAQQGYRVGDVRGGISVAVPLTPLLAIQYRSVESLALAHFVLWALGISGIILASKRLHKSEMERAHAERELRFISSHDALTGLRNRAFFQSEIDRYKQMDEFPISIVMSDLDGLKRANDTLGHSAGDELLQRAARVLQASVRSQDIVARIGGDEFVAILPRTSALIVQTIVERIRDHIVQDNAQNSAVVLSLSIGTATAAQAQDISAALRSADGEMYADKKTRGDLATAAQG